MQIGEIDPLTAESLRAVLATQVFGAEIVCLHETSSTNDVARNMAQRGGKDGTIVLAEAQTAGRGRQRRKWLSPRGVGIYMSMILRSAFHTRRPEALSLLGAFTTATAIRAEAGVRAEVKWPNDVIIKQKKVAGVLGESGHGGGTPFVILGIGVNVNTERKDFAPEIAGTATSIRAECGKAVSRAHLVASILGRFEEFYLRPEPGALADLVAAIKPICPMLGHTVSVRRESEIVTGKALDIDETGALIIETGYEETRKLSGGQVTIIGG